MREAFAILEIPPGRTTLSAAKRAYHKRMAEYHPDKVSALGVSDHFKPASNYRNDPAIKNCLSRHFSSKQARCNSLVSGLFERKMPLLL